MAATAHRQDRRPTSRCTEADKDLGHTDVRSIPEKDLDGHDFTSKEIVAVYRDPSDRWVHVLLKSASREVYLVIVVDQTRRSVHGHHLLDLHRLYGLDALSAD